MHLKSFLPLCLYMLVAVQSSAQQKAHGIKAYEIKDTSAPAFVIRQSPAPAKQPPAAAQAIAQPAATLAKQPAGTPAPAAKQPVAAAQ